MKKANILVASAGGHTGTPAGYQLLEQGDPVRAAAVMLTGIMGVATSVHMVVDDPSLFHLQPNEPNIPLVVNVISPYVSRKGADSWSHGLKVRAA